MFEQYEMISNNNYERMRVSLFRDTEGAVHMNVIVLSKAPAVGAVQGGYLYCGGSAIALLCSKNGFACDQVVVTFDFEGDDLRETLLPFRTGLINIVGKGIIPNDLSMTSPGTCGKTTVVYTLRRSQITPL